MSAALIASLPLAQSDDFFTDRTTEEATCVQDNASVCFGWAIDNADRYVGPTLEHLVLVIVSVVLGFVLSLGLAILSHRRRWLQPLFVGGTGVIYTIPSIALFLLLLPVTGRGDVTAIIALTLYNLMIIYRNMLSGLANVPESAREAGRGVGMTDRQLLWKVELPLAVPEIIAGLRIATVSTVAIATLAVFAGGGGLGGEIYNSIQQGAFKTGILVPSLIAVTMAVSFDVLYLLLQRVLSPWRTVRPT
jgi:osmoprotectant transport system permease protein